MRECNVNKQETENSAEEKDAQNETTPNNYAKERRRKKQGPCLPHHGPFSCSDHGRGGGGDLRPHLGTLLGDGAGDGGALHFALVVHDHAGVVLKADEDALTT